MFAPPPRVLKVLLSHVAAVLLLTDTFAAQQIPGIFIQQLVCSPAIAAMVWEEFEDISLVFRCCLLFVVVVEQTVNRRLLVF